MKPIRILIADDDEGMRILLQGIIAKVEEYELVGVAQDGNALLDLYEREKPQAVIMDVEMPGMTGVECARLIQDRDPRCVLIFVTAHEKYMGDAFQVYAFDYLIKPFPVDRALKTLKMAAMRIDDMRSHAQGAETVPMLKGPRRKSDRRRLMIRSKDGVSFVDMEDILLVQREERQTVVYASGGRTYATSEPLSEIEEKLDAELFYRSHRSYIINLDHVDTVTPYGRWTYVVAMEGCDQTALITAERFEELKQAFA